MSVISSYDFIAKLAENRVVPKSCYRVLLRIPASDRPYSTCLWIQTRPGAQLWHEGPLLEISGREMMHMLGDIIPGNACLVVFDAALDEPLQMEITTIVNDEDLVRKVIEVSNERCVDRADGL